MSWWKLAALAALLAAASPATAQTPPDGFTWMVLNRLNAFYSDPDDPTNRPPLITEVPSGVLIPQDVTRDGVTDWLVAWPDASQFCGTGGCQKTLYVSEDGGYRRIFDQQTLGDLTFGPRDGHGMVVEAWVHHTECPPEREKCLVAWRWDEARRQLVEIPASDSLVLLSGFGYPTVDLDPQNLPVPLNSEYRTSRRFCSAAHEPDGVFIRRAEVVSVADLNGDGRRDWIYTAPGECEGAETPGFTIWVTGEGDEVTQAYQAASDRYGNLDLGGEPPQVIVRQPCESGQSCPTIRLAWNAATRRFDETPGPSMPSSW